MEVRIAAILPIMAVVAMRGRRRPAAVNEMIKTAAAIGGLALATAASSLSEYYMQLNCPEEAWSNKKCTFLWGVIVVTSVISVGSVARAVFLI